MGRIMGAMVWGCLTVIGIGVIVLAWSVIVFPVFEQIPIVLGIR